MASTTLPSAVNRSRPRIDCRSHRGPPRWTRTGSEAKARGIPPAKAGGVDNDIEDGMYVTDKVEAW